MRSKLLAAALAPALILGLTASPAMAQMQGRHNGPSHAWALTPARNAEIRADINGLRQAIDRAAARRTISPREATALRSNARETQRIYASYARGGLTRSEVSALQNRVNAIRGQLRMERRDWDGHRG